MPSYIHNSPFKTPTSIQRIKTYLLLQQVAFLHFAIIALYFQITEWLMFLVGYNNSQIGTVRSILFNLNAPLWGVNLNRGQSQQLMQNFQRMVHGRA